jgi:hypothetical protein
MPRQAGTTLEIPKQEIEPYMKSGFCENLSFTPWHALPEHRPVGGLNRVRQYVYQSISSYRHCKNATVQAEPPDDGSAVLPGMPCDPNQPVNQPLHQPLNQPGAPDQY